MTPADIQTKIAEFADWFEQQDSDYYAPFVIEWVQKALLHFPDEAALYYWWGMAQVSLGEYAQAKLQFQKAIDLDLKYTDAYLRLVDCIVDIGTEEEYLQCREICRRAIQYNPFSVEAWQRLISSYPQNHNNPQALVDCKEMLEWNPDQALAHFYAAQLYTAHQDIPLAFEHYQKAIALDSKNRDFYYSRSFLHTKEGNYEAALEDLYKCQEGKGPYVLYYHVVPLQILLGRYEDALASCEAEIQRSKSEMAYSYRAKTHSAMGNQSEAIADISIAISKAPKYEPALKAFFYSERAIFLVLDNQFDSAIKDIDAALALTKYYAQKAHFLIQKAMIYCHQLQDKETAKALAQQADDLFLTNNQLPKERLLTAEDLAFLKKILH